MSVLRGACKNTMQGNIVSWRDLYEESHGLYPSERALNEAHRKIVEAIKRGEIELKRE